MTPEEIALSQSTPSARFDRESAPPPADAEQVAVTEEARAFVRDAIESEREPVVLFALKWCEFTWSVRRLFARCGTLPPVPAPDNAATARVYEYLARHFAEEVPLARLAAIAALSPFHLARRFTRDRGLSPHACQTLLRLQAAKRLLKAGRSPADAALETGFFDQSHFHRHFRRLVGMTPGRYAGSPR
jgi:AraC-like DNA-binding protein